MALIEMGFPFYDADNKEAEEIKSASFLFDKAVMVLLREYWFTGNIKKIKPILTDRKIYLGKREYVRPANCISVLTPEIEEIGDKLYTMKNNFSLEYREKMSIEDIPEVYDTYIALTLAKMIAPTIGKAKAINRVMVLLEEEKRSLLPLASYNITMEDLS